jgi:2,4-dienoyl-CoA reductase-like NADH-dependent reductase (Old Yellow Enzyme family)
MSALFTPVRVGVLELANRVVIAPMCQYSAANGCMTDWHLIHLGHLALSGAALLTIEATAVVPEGRITYADVGLWNDETEAAIARTLDSIWRWSDIPIAIQLAHAGRKASTEDRGKVGCRSHPTVQDVRAVCDSLPGQRSPAGRPRPRRAHAGARGLRCNGPARRPARNPCRPAPRRARLFAAPVPVAALQPAQR